MMTKKEFLARCAMAWDAKVITQERLQLLAHWVDAIFRLEGGQTRYWAEFLSRECERCEPGSYGNIGRLASEPDGYALIKFTAILTHPCQQCATDKHAWWTRTAFCPHLKEASE